MKPMSPADGNYVGTQSLMKVRNATYLHRYMNPSIDYSLPIRYLLIRRCYCQLKRTEEQVVCQSFMIVRI